MQAVVFHRFAYTPCTAFFQPICKMSTISFKALTNRAFPHGCYRTLAEYKGSAFLGISAVYGGILRSDYLGYSIRWKSVAKPSYSLEKVFVCHNGTLLFEENHYILSGIILCFTEILYLKWYKLIDLTELHNVEHLI